jgi:hypothetical protein
MPINHVVSRMYFFEIMYVYILAAIIILCITDDSLSVFKAADFGILLQSRSFGVRALSVV